MRNFLAAVLSVIAVGVLLIAYGLLAPRAIAAPVDVAGAGGGTVTLDPNRYPAFAQPVSSLAQPAYANERVVYVTQPAASTRTFARSSAARTRVNEPKRDWKKTALVIGGTSAAGAGVGGAVGGTKGALIGAAIGGGASTLWEALHK